MEEAEDMKRYVALLRGINISGKIKVPMAELKTGFEKLAFEEVKTYLNSGNVIFSSDEDDTKKLTKQIQDFSDVYSEIGEPNKELENIEGYKDVIFWSFNRKDYQKTNWWSKTASANISTKLTIRTANTVRKIVKM